MAATATDAREEQSGTRSATLLAGAIGVALTLGAAALYGARSAFSVGVGAVIGVSNLVVMNMIVRALIRGEGSESGSGSGSESGSGSGSESGRGRGSGSEGGSGRESEGGRGSGRGSGSGRESEGGSGRESESESGGDAGDEESDEKRAVEAQHVAEGKRGGAMWGVFAALKILVLFGGIWILLTRGLVDPIPLVVGYGVLPLGIAASGLRASLAPRGSKRGRRAPSRTRRG